MLSTTRREASVLTTLCLLGSATLFARQSDSADVVAARSSSLYYMLDWGRGELVLALRGVELRRYVTVSAEVGERPGGGSGESAEARLYDCRRVDVLEPKDVPPRGKRAEIVLGEEDDPRPSSFRASCGPELSVRFARPSLPSLVRWLQDHWPSGNETRGARRLRIVLPEEEFAALYRAMPVSFFLIVPPIPPFR